MKFNINTLLNILLAGMVILLIGRYFYLKPAFINGEQAPDFSAQLIDGTNFQLSDLRGHYVLLDFWGSWCGPCRANNPKLVELYRKYRQARFKSAEGFEIVSVGIERDAHSWRQAIERDGLTWPYQILDETTSSKFFNGQLADLYKIKEVPTTFLINQEGIIIGVNLDASRLDDRLAEKTVAGR